MQRGTVLKTQALRMFFLFPISVLESYGFSPQVSFRVQYPQDYLDLSHEDCKEFKQTRYGNASLEYSVICLLSFTNSESSFIPLMWFKRYLILSCLWKHAKEFGKGYF